MGLRGKEKRRILLLTVAALAAGTRGTAQRIPCGILVDRAVAIVVLPVAHLVDARRVVQADLGRALAVPDAVLALVEVCPVAGLAVPALVHAVRRVQVAVVEGAALAEGGSKPMEESGLRRTGREGPVPYRQTCRVG